MDALNKIYPYWQRLKISELGGSMKWCTCWCVVEHAEIEVRCTAIISGCAVVPDDQHFIVAFEAPHGPYVALATVLLSPFPIRTSDNSRTDALHL